MSLKWAHLHASMALGKVLENWRTGALAKLLTDSIASVNSATVLLNQGTPISLGSGAQHSGHLAVEAGERNSLSAPFTQELM